MDKMKMDFQKAKVFLASMKRQMAEASKHENGGFEMAFGQLQRHMKMPVREAEFAEFRAECREFYSEEQSHEVDDHS